MFGEGGSAEPVHEVYGKVRERKLRRMFNSQLRKKSVAPKKLGIVWFEVPQRGFLASFSMELLVLEIVPPAADKPTWTLRGLISTTNPWEVSSFYRGMARTIEYDPVNRGGVETNWRDHPVPEKTEHGYVSIGDMLNMVSELR